MCLKSGSATVRRRWLARLLMERCEASGGRCLIISTAHDGGKKLKALGGLGALLRYVM